MEGLRVTLIERSARTVRRPRWSRYGMTYLIIREKNWNFAWTRYEVCQVELGYAMYDIEPHTSEQNGVRRTAQFWLEIIESRIPIEVGGSEGHADPNQRPIKFGGCGGPSYAGQIRVSTNRGIERRS